MSQRIALEAHSTFGPMTASAVLQVCPGSAGPQVCSPNISPQVCSPNISPQVCSPSVSPQVCPGSAGPQVRPASTIVADPSPALKFLELCDPRRWSKDDYSRFAVVAVVLLELLRQISSFFIIPRS